MVQTPLQAWTMGVEHRGGMVTVDEEMEECGRQENEVFPCLMTSLGSILVFAGAIKKSVVLKRLRNYFGKVPYRR
jgi:hypothetical protein